MKNKNVHKPDAPKYRQLPAHVMTFGIFSQPLNPDSLRAEAKRIRNRRRRKELRDLSRKINRKRKD